MDWMAPSWQENWDKYHCWLEMKDMENWERWGKSCLPLCYYCHPHCAAVERTLERLRSVACVVHCE